jgi:hypothetical protein
VVGLASDQFFLREVRDKRYPSNSRERHVQGASTRAAMGPVV